MRGARPCDLGGGIGWRGVSCLGSEGSPRRAVKLRGAIAAAVAQLAQCPVAVIRTNGDTPQSKSDDIAVIVDDALDGGAVLEAALEEARLRNATLLALKVAPSRVGEVLSPEEVKSPTDCLAMSLSGRSDTYPGGVAGHFGIHRRTRPTRSVSGHGQCRR